MDSSPSLRDLLAEADAAYAEAMAYYARVHADCGIASAAASLHADAALLKLLYANDLYMRALCNLVDPSVRASIREKSSALLRKAAELSDAPSQLAQTRGSTCAQVAAPLVRSSCPAALGARSAVSLVGVLGESGYTAPVGVEAPGATRRKEEVLKLIAVERKFCRRLEVFAQEIIGPLKPRKASGHWGLLGTLLHRELLTSDEHALIFSAIELQVLPLHRQLLQNLEVAVDAHGAMACVGNTLVFFAHGFKLYYEGIEHTLKVPQLLARLNEEREGLADFIDAKSSVVGLPFFDVLTLPFQHVCQYPGIIESIKKYTHPAHPDFKALDAAREQVPCSEGGSSAEAPPVTTASLPRVCRS